MDRERFDELVAAALVEHFTLVLELSDSMRIVALDRDARIRPRDHGLGVETEELLVEAASYGMYDNPETGDTELWEMAMSIDPALRERAAAGEDIGEFDVGFSFRPVPAPCSGGTMLFREMCTWLAVEDAEAGGRADEAAALLDFAYRPVEEGQEGEEAVRVDGVALRRAHAPVSKPTQVLAEPALFGDGMTLLDTSRGGRRRSFTGMSLSYDVPDDAVLSRPIDEVDKTVISAYATVVEEGGGRPFDAVALCKAMGIKKPSAKQRGEVMARVRKLMRTTVRLDMTEEANRRFRDVGLLQIEGHLIEARIITVRTRNGELVEGIEPLRGKNNPTGLPPTYLHAQAAGQVVVYPSRYLELGAGSNTPRNITLRRMVLERVFQLKNSKSSVSARIRVARNPRTPERPVEIEAAGFDVSDEKDRAKAVKFICSVLDGLREAGEIKGYAVRNEAGGEARGSGAAGRRAYVEIDV